MIYINQTGHCELGRGETIADALNMARSSGFEITEEELKSAHERMLDEDCYWTDQPNPDYNT